MVLHRVAAVAAAGVLAVLALLLAVGWQAQRAQTMHWQARLDSHLLRQLRGVTENQLATGLQLDQMPALQDVIEREQGAFPRVLAIDVFDAGGTVLYSTDADSRGQPVPQRWRQQLQRHDAWTLPDVQQRLIGQRFENDLGQAAGAIVVTLSTASPAPTLMQWRARVLRALRWLGLALVASLLAGAAAWLGLRRQFAPYDRACRVLQGPAAAADAQEADALVRATQGQRQRWQQQQRVLARAREQLEALDDAA